MASEAAKSEDLLPQVKKETYMEKLGLSDLDPEDPNVVNMDMDLVHKMVELQENLPEGWSRNSDFSKTRAPFLHVSGKESFKHPNRPQMDALVKAADKSRKAGLNQHAQKSKQSSIPDPESATNRAQIKKLRMMLQNGIPMGAVEQSAKLKGIDMALVLGEEKNDHDETLTTASSEETIIIPQPLLKKYKRMIKTGVPLSGVQAMAFIDGKFTPEEVAHALDDILDKDNEAHKIHFKLRQKLPRRQPPSPKKFQESLQKVATSAVNQEKAFFTPAEGNKKVSFPGASVLAALVRKMAQTVEKRASTSSDSTMVIDSLTLYNALGALKGVQVARDRYNSTCDISHQSRGQNWIPELRAKRQFFVEIARTISLDLPKNFQSYVQIEGLDELVEHIEMTFEKELNDLKSQVEDGWYEFDSLAQLYPPGSRVIAKNAGGGGVDMVCQVAWNRYEQGRTIMGQPMKYFKVCFQFVVAVGASQATIAEVVEGMEFFEGRRRIHSALNFVPFAAYTDEQKEGLLARYRRRGETYNKVALRGEHVYMSYEKGCFFLKRGGSTLANSATSATSLATGGRIIVDTQGAYDNGHSLGVGYDPMVTGIKYKYKEYSLHLRSTKKENQQADKHAKDMHSNSLILFDQVPEDLLDLVWPSVVGFSLTAKAWGDVLVDGLEDIKWQENIFNHLVLPESRKTMVKALVRHGSDSFQDLVKGKGEGTVFLMYGPPGVGKTLTAEAVAELLHKPLYSLSLGTLGTTPAELEQRLGQIMNLSAKWDALILLDEADSFLETRSSSSSLERNAMVSVMLKLVEYFSGILFLTSNRIDSLDPAFQTRITLALRYEQLNREARAKVWKILLVKSGFESKVKNGIIDPSKLAKAILNGREIKNALRLAMAMAAEKEVPLSQAILLETVLIVNDYKSSMINASPFGEEQMQIERRMGWCLPWRK